MLLHPHTLHLIVQYKKSNEVDLLKEILALLIDSEPVYIKDSLYDIIYSHTKTDSTKKQNIENLNNCIDLHFEIKEKTGDKEHSLYYFLKDFRDLSPEGVQLVKNRRKNLQRRERQKKKKLSKSNNENICESDVKAYDEGVLEKLKDFEIFLVNLKESERNLKIICEYKDLLLSSANTIINIFNDMYEKSKISKKDYTAIMSSIRTNSRPISSSVDNTSSNLSLLNFITKEKRKTVEVDNRKRFVPIEFDSSVYVYKLNNPNFESIRRRKDLVNPVKMMFIKFCEDIRPPIYRQSDNKLSHKISYVKILNDVDYDEESTWEDDPDAESIDSDDSEEEESASEDNEFIEADSGEQEKKRVKKPVMSFPVVKIETNKEFDPLFRQLPIVPTKLIPDFIKDKLKEDFNLSDKNPSIFKRLSKKYLVVESALKEHLEKT